METETVPTVQWTEGGHTRSARWRSERGASPPTRVLIADDRMTAAEAYGLACQGTALLWRGDFNNARQLLIAIARRADRKAQRARDPSPDAAPPRSSAERFHLHRQAQSQRARTLGMLLIELDADYRIALRRAPDLRQACVEAYGPAESTSLVALRELLGVIGAHEWRAKGIEISAIDGRIHPHYGVFAPIRREYIDLVANAPLPGADATLAVAFDIGTGTGVLAAVLARRGIRRIVATDRDPRALDCARANIARLGLTRRVEVVEADLFPEGRAPLVVCNPPWIPARPSAPIEHGIFDPESRMLHGFLAAVPAHLEAHGEAWLVLSDLAEHLGLRSRADLLAVFDAAALDVVARHDVRPTHSRADDTNDPLYAARRAEVTSLWRLAVR
ncbi:MAG: class I SAM-dependent methyltransferase [Casimicrobiaceae bacterium]